MRVDPICGCTITRQQLARDLALIRLDLAKCNGKYPEFKDVLERREAELVKLLEAES